MVFDDKTERLLAVLASLLDLGEEGRSLLRAALKREDGNAVGVLADWMEERGYRNPMPPQRDLVTPVGERRAAILRVPWETLRSVLLLPDNCRLNAISQNAYFESDEVALRVESPEFPDTPHGSALPTLAVRYSSVQQPDGTRLPRFDGWSW